MRYFFLLIGFCVIIASCNKDDNNSNGEFHWSEDGGVNSYTADSAFYVRYNGGISIRAYRNGLSQYMQLSIGDTSIGTHNFTSGFTYLVGSNTTYSLNGTISISANTGNKLSGVFFVALTGGSTGTVNATFIDLQGR